MKTLPAGNIRKRIYLYILKQIITNICSCVFVVLHKYTFPIRYCCIPTCTVNDQA